MASAVMVIAHQGFRDEELFDTKAELIRAGVDVKVASTDLRPAKGSICRVSNVDMLLENVGTNFDAIVFVGGPGAKQFYTNPRALLLAKKYYTANKVVAAICVAPGILVKAGILNNKKATIWNDDDTMADMIINAGGNYTGNDVEVSGKIITANGPAVARKFGKAIVEALGL